MNNKDRTKEALLDELQRLELENQQLKALYEKEISEFRLEKELVEKKMLSFEAVCESSPVPMLIVDDTTNIVMANLAAIKLCDSDEEDVLNHRPGNALRCIHSSKDPRGCGYSVECKICTLRNAVELLIEKGGSLNGAEVEMLLLRNGKLQKVWVNVGIEPLMLGGIKHWCIALNDISKHKLVAVSLLEGEARFREVLENSIDASYKRNLQTNKYDYLSPVFCQIAGYSQDELNSLSSEIIWKQVHPDDFPGMARFIQIAITETENKSYQLEYRFRHKVTGEYHWFNDKFTVMHDAQGCPIALIGSVGDITARKVSEEALENYKVNLEKLIAERTESLQHEIELRIQTEEALRESENKYRNIVDYSNSIILEWDIDGNILFMNKYGLDFFGFQPYEIVGKNVLGTIVEDKDTSGFDLKGKIKKVQKNPEEFQSNENENVRKNGEKVWIAWTNKGISDANGRLLKTLSVGFDRTQQHEMEKALQNYRDHLEKMVNERTEELMATNQQLVDEIKVRRVVENSLKENERMLLESQSIAQLGTFEIDLATDVLKTSAILDEIYGIDKNFDKTVEGWFGLIHPEDRTMIHEYFINDVITKGCPFEKEFRIVKFNDKSIRWVHCLAKLETETNYTKLIGISRDITVRKKTEKLLELNSFRIETLLKLNQMTDANFKDITDFSLKQAVELTQSKIGYLVFFNEDESVMNLNFWPTSMVARCDIDEKSNLNTIMDIGLMDETVKQRKPIVVNDYLSENNMDKTALQGGLGLMRQMNVPVFVGNRIVLVAGVGNKSEDYSLNDVDELTLLMEGMWRLIERKRAETELIEAKEKVEESEFRLKLATASWQLGIWDWDVKKNVLIWDDRMYELYGVAKDTFLKNIDAWVNRLHPEDKQMAMDAINAALVGTKDFNLSFRVLHLDGTILYLKGNGTVIRDDDGTPIRMIGINKDITISKQAEIQLLIAKEKAEESDRLKTAFLNNISHEIRTPLNGILGFASYIIQPNISQKEKEAYMSELNHSSFRLINTVTDFMDMSLISSGNMHANINLVDAYSLVQVLHHRFLSDCEQKKLELKIQHSKLPIGTILKSDEELLVKALSHLMTNAIKFTPDGSIRLGYEMKNSELVFFVSDTGVGISEEFQERIFEVFMQENISNTRGYEGSGLGLSIASGIVKLLGGKIWLESKKMAGTTVFISIPVESNVVLDGKDSSVEIKSVNKLSLVLIAEDDDVSYRLIEVIMRHLSDKIIRATDGKEAISLCLKYPEIDFILMDMKMPIMDGFEATRKIRQFNKNVIIIAQTAYGLTGDKTKAIEAGCDDYISKPIKKDELIAMIQKRIKP